MAPQKNVTSAPPIAALKPHKVAFGAVVGENRGKNCFKEVRYRDDPWFWLRDDTRKNEEVLDHLRKENAYTEEKTKHLVSFREKLYDEHISHLKETNEDPPTPHGKYFYYTRMEKGLAYKLHCRKEASNLETFSNPDTIEEVVLDENAIAEGHQQCFIKDVKLSPDHTMLAYTVDFKGNETYAIYLVNLVTGETLNNKVEVVSRGIQWGKDNKIIFYNTEDNAKRRFKLWKHVIGTKQDVDMCIFTEEDKTFRLDIAKSKDGCYLFSYSSTKETTEISFIDLHASETKLLTFQRREKGLRYWVEHISTGRFLIWTNIYNANNNRLMSTTVDKPEKNNWIEIIPYDSTRRINYIDVFSGFIAIGGRQGGLTQIWTIKINKNNGRDDIDPTTLKKIEWPEPMYKCLVMSNKLYETTLLRTFYSSLTTPGMWQDYNVESGKFSLVKVENFLNFDSSSYACKRLFATANDGTQIPISMVHKKDVEIGNGNTPTMLSGYGGYGICKDPIFDKMILPYLDRGMVYAIAHIRGGGEMGACWYEEQGKYLNKRNTFTDFINCAEYLIQTNVTNPEKLAIEGRSAGGLLVGAVINMRPDLFKVAVAGVPFVDTMNTLGDPSIPLTTYDWEELGNPNESKYFDYILSYSPYDNVREQPYPNIVITCGLNDPRVAYWEPAKWASKLKSLKTDENDVLLKTELKSGHYSASDRYKYIREKTFEQSLVLYYLVGLIS